MADLENRMSEPWFDPAGFFLCIHDDIIVGFCWTKIHQDLVNADPVGELYVIGVDPEEHSKGIGKTVCNEGLIYLRSKGIKESILYVDADNEAGKGLYTSLGFNQPAFSLILASDKIGADTIKDRSMRINISLCRSR
mgnify:CR=1 FL=1